MHIILGGRKKILLFLIQLKSIGGIIVIKWKMDGWRVVKNVMSANFKDDKRINLSIDTRFVTQIFNLN
jgi:hypothetical protein